MFALLLTITTSPVIESINIGDKVSSAAQSQASFFDLFLQADFTVKLVMLLLLLVSVWNWAIIFEKFISFRVIRLRMAKFMHAFKSAPSVDIFLQNLGKSRETHPLASILSAAIEEYVNASTFRANFHSGTIKDRIRQSMQIAANRSTIDLERNLGFLATAGSASPFVGLFGTVWGIMSSFRSIAMAKNATLAVVAPGIAEALLATALGFVAAIPAVIFYNKFLSELTEIMNEIENFQLEVSNMMLRKLDTDDYID